MIRSMIPGEHMCELCSKIVEKILSVTLGSTAAECVGTPNPDVNNDREEEEKLSK